MSGPQPGVRADENWLACLNLALHRRGEASSRIARRILGHPRGTLVIVIVFGLLFGLAWLAMYLFLFLQRGAPHS